MTDAELLSRLLDGDLDPAAEQSLRARIAAEPALARQWDRMQALPLALAALPGVGPPPPLRPPVAEARPRSTAPRLAAAAAIGLALGAAAGLALRPSAPDITLTGGVHAVEGIARVYAAGHTVAVDGEATITMEPPAGSMRATAPAQEEPMQLRTAALGAAAGAALTVAVYEGSAVVTAPDGSTETIEAGETRTLGAPPRAPTRDSRVNRRTESNSDAAALTARVSELEAENDRLRLQATLAEGQLTAHIGEPTAWPDAPPPGLAPADFQQMVDDAVAELGDTRVMAVDCSEYPCLAVLAATGDPATWDGWEDRVKAVHEGVDDAGLDGGAAVSGWAARAKDATSGSDQLVYAFAVLPGAEAEGPAGRRLQTRGEDAVRDALTEGPPAEGETVDDDILRALENVGYIGED